MADYRFYYLENFETALAWIGRRYADLLDAGERGFLAGFAALPLASRALLVRMLMRKGELFRASKLRYEEIGAAEAAAGPLAAAGWIDDAPALGLDELFGLLTKPELVKVFGLRAPLAGLRKAEQLEALRGAAGVPRGFDQWCAGALGDTVYRVRIAELCRRLRLMFFGNLHQDWSEFVLADLGIFKYEKVGIGDSSRGFQSRDDIDDYLLLNHCRERLELGEPAEEILAAARAAGCANAWLAGRREKLLFQLARQLERRKEWAAALDIYRGCAYPGARARAIRMLELGGCAADAFALLQSAERSPEGEAEVQQLARVAPRLRRKLGLAHHPGDAAPPPAEFTLTIPKPPAPVTVEQASAAHLQEELAPVYYVENTLINSLFGLLCWNAVFAAVPGAFFHPFHHGPADLHSADFRLRRTAEFEAYLALLDNGGHGEAMRTVFREKFGTLSPFVFWEILNEELLELALDCIPPRHLRLCFERILSDIGGNRSGLPDLIQFWPRERRYRMIEVKGPGDRLQDNQSRWLAYCARHGLPVEVCYVRWAEEGA